MQAWFFKKRVFIAILCFIFFSSFAYCDVIESKQKMAIGIVQINCTNNNFTTKGFLSEIYNIKNNTIELFDIKPNYKYGEISCDILTANIYNTKGELLDIIIRKKNKKNNPIILLLAFTIFTLIIYKKSRKH